MLTQRNELFELMKKFEEKSKRKEKTKEKHFAFRNTKNRFEPSIEQIRMNDEELRDFLRDSQKVKSDKSSAEQNFSLQNFYSIEKVRALIEEFELDEKSRQENLLTIDGRFDENDADRKINERNIFLPSGFRNLLLSKEFDIIKTSLTENVYQDMTRSTNFLCFSHRAKTRFFFRPLCDYFINTSHNT